MSLELQTVRNLLLDAFSELKIEATQDQRVSWIAKVSPFVHEYIEEGNEIVDVRRMAAAWAGYYSLHDDLENLAVLVAISGRAFTEVGYEPYIEPILEPATVARAGMFTVSNGQITGRLLSVESSFK